MSNFRETAVDSRTFSVPHWIFEESLTKSERLVLIALFKLEDEMGAHMLPFICTAEQIRSYAKLSIRAIRTALSVLKLNWLISYQVIDGKTEYKVIKR